MGRPRKNNSASSGGSSKKVHGLEGAFDAITETSSVWDAVLRRFAKISRVYGFARVETPLLEDWALYENFYRAGRENLPFIAEAQAEGRPAAIRPALLPSILRAYSQNKVYESSPLSKWSFGGMVVKNNPQDSVFESDYEFGFEVMGAFNHLTEAQVIGAVWEMLQSLGIGGLSLEINNLGRDECQASYQETLRDFLSGKKYDLCDSCNEHLQGRALNVFRCKSLDCQAVLSEAPTILDFLDQDSHKHFTNILEALDELGIPYQLNPLHSGPDGYGKTNFVVKYKLQDEVRVLGEGGYHDSLVQNIFGKPLQSFGFCGSLLKLKEYLENDEVAVLKEQKSDVFLVPLGELASKKSLRLFRDLTNEKIMVYDHFGQSGVKNQLKQAEAFKAPVALIMGQKEAMDEMVILRDVKSGMQEIISYDKIVEEVKKRLGR